MKRFITNHAQKKLENNQGGICVHYYEDCHRLNADYEEDDLSIPNSGVTELKIKNEKRFELLTLLGAFFVCPKCEYRDCVAVHESFSNQRRGEETYLNSE